MFQQIEPSEGLWSAIIQYRQESYRLIFDYNIRYLQLFGGCQSCRAWRMVCTSSRCLQTEEWKPWGCRLSNKNNVLCV